MNKKKILIDYLKRENKDTTTEEFAILADSIKTPIGKLVVQAADLKTQIIFCKRRGIRPHYFRLQLRKILKQIK